MSMLIFGIRFLLEVHPDWVVVRLDLRNAYNELKRSQMVERLASVDHVRDLAPVVWATYSAESEVYWVGANGLERAFFASEEGAQQGDGLASAGFCVAIHPEVRLLDEELRAHGGTAIKAKSSWHSPARKPCTRVYKESHSTAEIAESSSGQGRTRATQ